MFKKILLSLYIIISPLLIFAQGDPCSDQDPLDNSCPLDTWVIVLAFGAVTMAAVHLYRRKVQAESAKLKAQS